jgi:hypothetical protein
MRKIILLLTIFPFITSAYAQNGVAVFRPAERAWYFDFDLDGKTDKKVESWGDKGDIPVVGKFQ